MKKLFKIENILKLLWIPVSVLLGIVLVIFNKPLPLYVAMVYLLAGLLKHLYMMTVLKVPGRFEFGQDLLSVLFGILAWISLKSGLALYEIAMYRSEIWDWQQAATFERFCQSASLVFGFGVVVYRSNHVVDPYREHDDKDWILYLFSTVVSFTLAFALGLL